MGAMLSLNQVFESFDPKDGEVKDLSLNGYAQRARGILEKRSSREIRGAVMIAEWMVQQRINVPPEDLPRFSGRLSDSLPRILRRRISYFDIEGIDDPADVTWPEIFAAIAIAYVALNESNPQPDRVMAAVEAVSIAETFRDQADAMAAGIQEGISVPARLGGQAKARKYDALRRKVEAHWENGAFTTYIACAKDFEANEPKINSILPGKNRLRTLCDWISSYSKRNGSRNRP